MARFIRAPLSLAGVVSLVLASPGFSKIPDPGTSTCGFPGGEITCDAPVTIPVTLRDAFGLPVASCSTAVTIVLDSGALRGGQQMIAGGVTDGNGDVDLTFAGGIHGDGAIHFSVSCFCYGPIPICESETHGIACTGPVGVGDSWEHGTWGRVKALYR